MLVMYHKRYEVQKLSVMYDKHQEVSEVGLWVIKTPLGTLRWDYFFTALVKKSLLSWKCVEI